MSALKKATSCILTPEYSRRSSLSLLDKNYENYLSELVVKLKFSPSFRDSFCSVLPQIVFDEEPPSSTNCPVNDEQREFGGCNLQSNPRRSSLVSPSIEYKTQSRRASCGPCLQLWRTPSPEKNFDDENEVHRRPWRRRASSPKWGCFDRHPGGPEEETEALLKVPPRNRGTSSGEVTGSRKSSDSTQSPFLSPINFQQSLHKSSPNSANASLLRIPSLSPCFEDQPKKAFDFGSNFAEGPQRTTSNGVSPKFRPFDKRRLSYHSPGSIPLSRFPHAGVFWCEETPLRNQQREAPCMRSLPPPSLKVRADINNNTVGQADKEWVAPIKLSNVGEVLGRGGFGTVRVGVWKGKKVAVKCIKGKKLSSLDHEMHLLGVDAHPSLVTTHEIYIKDSRSGRVRSCLSKSPPKDSLRRITLPSLFSEEMYNQEATVRCGPSPWDKAAWVVSELCSSINLLTLINSTEVKWSLKEKIRILEQISLALAHLHSLGLVHLDVKPSNCFFTVAGKPKLGDFGCCSKVGDTPNQILGTVVYQAPEVLRGRVVSEKSDIYSLGATAWHLLTQEVPYRGLHPHVVIYKVTRLGCRPNEGARFPISSPLASLLLNIIESCWKEDFDLRPSASSVRRVLAALHLCPTNE